MMLKSASVEELLSMFDSSPPNCDARHGPDAPFGPCTSTVTHRAHAKCTGRQSNLCTRAARYLIECIESGRTCSGCGRIVADCWGVHLI